MTSYHEDYAASLGATVAQRDLRPVGDKTTPRDAAELNMRAAFVLTGTLLY